MSYLKLYRKEAVKQQFQSKEYGEAVVQQPDGFARSIGMLCICLAVLGLLIAFVPINATKYYAILSHESNYEPLVIPSESVVVKHFIQAGSVVESQTRVAHVRFFEATGEIKNFTVESSGRGIYFPTVDEGNTSLPYQAIGKVLKRSANQEYWFWVDVSSLSLHVNQKLDIVPNNNAVTGKVRYISSPYLNGKAKISLHLNAPFETSILDPNHAIKVRVQQKHKNIFDLLRT